MKRILPIFSLMLACALVGLQASAKEPDKGYSHVRIVRLSFVDGTALVRRPGSTEWAKASVNTPIEQGFSLSTSKDSFAEVEFENGSTARLGQLSEVDFSELALGPKGQKINRMTLDHGYGTFRVTEHHGDVYAIKAGATTLTPSSKAEFRTDFNNGALRVEVFDGSVDAAGPSQTAKVTKDKVLNASPQTEDAFNLSHGIKKDAWDQWVHERDQQAALAYDNSAIGMSSPMYGWSDLDTYGEWGYFPGFGYGWSPFVTAGWSPFSMGQWSFYPGMGYTWISSEPWGWLPFHYGNWNFEPGFGYFWTPGSFNTFSPGVVTWFNGPGYVGWAARGAGGVPVCLTNRGCVTAVKPGTLQNGGMVDPSTRVIVNADQITRIERPNVAPGSLSMLSGRPIEGNALIATRALTPGGLPLRAMGAPAAVGVARIQHVRTAFAPAAAPRVVIMGQSAAETARIHALAEHHSFFSRGAAQPLTARMGGTLGGSYVAGAGGRGLRAPEVMGRGGMVSREQPVFLQHRANAGFAGPRIQMTPHGAMRMERGGMRPSYQGESRGAMAAPRVSSAPVSAPPASAPMGRASAPAGPRK